MITLSSASSILKSVYLDVLANQLNVNTNPLLARLEKTTSDVYGKDIKKIAPYGINGGFGAGSETGALPKASSNNYVTLSATLKNLYGTIEISDKAIRSSETNVGTFINILNSEMDGLLVASKFNFSRMLFGDGTGKLATFVEYSGTGNKNLKVDTVRNLMEGMIINIYDGTEGVKASQIQITKIDRTTNVITIPTAVAGLDTSCFITIQGGLNNELTGVEAFFQNTSIYGLSRSSYPFLKGHTATASSGILNDSVIQTAIDTVDVNSGSNVNFITCSPSVRRLYQQYLVNTSRNVDVIELEGGFKALSYNGIPLVADKFVADGAMYLLNTDYIKIHQLCDWKWLEGDDGSVLKQIAGTPTYSATLVKYAEMVCDKINAQAKISGITTLA